MQTPESCAVCRRRLVPDAEWNALPLAERRAMRGTGQLRHRGRGLCGTCWEHANRDGTLLDHERRSVPADVVADEWAMHADRHRTQAENARLLAPRLGMSPEALTKAVQRLKVAA